MRQTNSQLLVEQKPLGVIDVLTAGFEIVRKRPWTMLIPLLLDLSIWILPRVSLAPLFRPVLDSMFNSAGASPDVATNLDQTRQAATQFVDSVNLLGLVAAALNSVVRLPSLLALEGGDVHSPINALAYTLQLDSGWLAAFIFIPLFLLGLFVAAVYVEWIAQGVRPLESVPPLAWAPRVATLWIKLVVFSALLGLILFFGGLVLSLSQVFSGIAGDAVSFIAAVIAVGFFWMFVYFFFVVSAMAVSQVGLIEAVRRSVLLFRLHFWATIGLVILVVFLDEGLSQFLWRGFTVSQLGVIVGVLANSFIGTSLLAASMVFYQDRMNWTEKMRSRAKPARR
jgi:hypothetical protein